MTRRRGRRPPAPAARRARRSCARRGRGEVAVAVDRMGGEIEAEALLLGGHPLRRATSSRPAACGSARRWPAVAEQAALPAGRARRRRWRRRRGSSRRRRTPAQRSAMPSNAPPPARLSSWRRLSRRGSMRRGEIVEAGEAAVRLALRDELLHRLLADALQRAERIADGEAVAMRSTVEFGLAGVDAGRQARDAHAAHVVDEDGQLVGLVHVEAHRRGVEFGRVMRLQPGGLVGDQRIGGGVALVEAIAGELVDQVEQLVGLACGDAVDPLRSPRRSRRAARPSPP